MADKRWLLFDADDTLWDNNVFFEVAIADFFDLVGIADERRPAARRQLDEIEVRNIRRQGYGAANFGRNLVEYLEQIQRRPATPAEESRIRSMANTVRDHPIELYPGVLETLRDLARRWRLALVTKGDRGEQEAKVDRSGVAGEFSHLEYLPEKDETRFRKLVCDLGASPSLTWMIGNSPKSDINPALAAGLGAVLVLNRNTWSLEQQPIPKAHPRLHVVERFPDVAELF